MKRWFPQWSHRTTRTKPSRKNSRSLLMETLENRDLFAVTTTNLSAPWLGIGPVNVTAEAGRTAGNVLGITESAVVGAVQAIAVGAGNTVYLGTVGGGVWKTVDITAAKPQWVPLTDQQPSLAISALRIDPNDPTKNTLWAGTGVTSNAGAFDNVTSGLLKTTDGGRTWTQLGAGQPIANLPFASKSLSGKNISSVVPTTISDIGVGPGFGGKIILVGTDESSPQNREQGLYISRDGGVSFSQVNGSLALLSGGATVAFPFGGVSDIVADPSDSHTFYAASPKQGIYKTTDTGSTWTLVNGAIPAPLVASSLKIHLSMNPAGSSLFAGIVDKTQQLSGLFLSKDHGATWTTLNLPGTVTKGVFSGVNPGEQGKWNFSMVADPADANVVWVAGDRQPDTSFTGNYGARILKIDATKDNAANPNNHGTQVVGPSASNTAPHPDTRVMTFLNNSTLLEGDDGGLYQLSNVSAANRTWSSKNGDLKASEARSVAYDPVNDVVITGTQDNGSLYQVSGGSPNWVSVIGGDGNSQAVGVEANSVFRYSLGNYLRTLMRREYDTTNKQKGVSVAPLLAAVGSKVPKSGLKMEDKDYDGFTRIPMVVNAIDPKRLAIGFNGMYISKDRGDSVEALDDKDKGTKVTAIAYGGTTKTGTENADLLYYARRNTIYVRKSAAGPITSTVVPNAKTIVDIVLDPNNGEVAYAVDLTHVFVTKDSGATWNDITGSLATNGQNIGFRSVEIVSLPAAGSNKAKDVLLVGAAGGVYRAENPIGDASTPSHYTSVPNADLVWAEMGGATIPNAPITDVRYYGSRQVNGKTVGDVLVAATLGRGVYTLRNAANFIRNDHVLRITSDITDDTIELEVDPTNAANLQVVVNGLETGTYPFDDISQIVVEGNGGNDQLIFDTRVLPVAGGVVFNGGTGSNRLNIVGQNGDSIIKEASANNAGTIAIGTKDGTHSIQFSNTDLPLIKANLNPPPPAGRGAQLGAGLGRAAGLFDRLRAKLPSSVPAISDVNGVLGGKTAADMEGNDPDAVPAAEDRDGQGTSIFQRIFEEGVGGFSLSQIGSTIVDMETIRQLFDGLDATPGNVTLMQSDAKTVFDIRVDKVLAGVSDFNLALFGDGFKLNGSVDMSAMVHVHLLAGVDDRGFFIDTQNNPDPELSVSDIHVSGDVEINTFAGLLTAGLKNTRFETAPGVALTLKLHEAADPLGGNSDGLIRPHEFNLATLNAVDVNVTSATNHDAEHPDVSFRTDLFFSFGGSPIEFNGVGIAWPDIHKPTEFQLSGMDPLADLIHTVQDAVIDGLEQVGTFATNIDTSSPLNEPLDFLGKDAHGASRTLGNTLNVGGLFNDRLVEPVREYFEELTDDPTLIKLPTLEGIKESILEANGLQNGVDTTFGPGFKIEQEGSALIIDFPVHFAREVPVSLDLGLDVPGLQLNTAADVTLRAAFDADLAIGFDVGQILARRPQDALFVEVNQAPQISAQILDDGGVSLDMTLAGLLGLGADIRGTIDTPNGKAMFTTGVALTFNDPDGRLTFSDLSRGIATLFSITPSAKVGLEIPIQLSLGEVPFPVDAKFKLRTFTEKGLFDVPQPALPPGTPAGTTSLASGRLLLEKPNFQRILNLGVLFTLIRDPSVLVDGVDSALESLQQSLDSEVTANNFPLVGEKLRDGAQFIDEFRSGILAKVRAATDNAGNRMIQFLQDGIYQILGPANLNVLVDKAGRLPAAGAKSSDFVKVTFPGDGTSVQLDMDIHKDKQFSLPFDLGLPGLPFSLDAAGAVKVGAAFDLHLGFGISIDPKVGFYVVPSAKDAQGKLIPQAKLGVTVTTPGLDVSGQLGLLGVRATDGDNEVRSVKLTPPVGAIAPTFTMTFRGRTTSPIRTDATADVVRMALETVVGQGNVDVRDPLTSLREYVIVFQGALANIDIANGDLTANLVGGPGTVSVTTQANGGTTKFAGTFSIDLVEPTGTATNPNDGRMTIAEMRGTAASNIVKPKFVGEADVHLHLTTGFGDIQIPAAMANLGLTKSIFPTIHSDLNVNWKFDTSVDASLAGASPTVAFDNVQLDLGSFLTDFVNPLIKNLQQVTKPLKSVIDALKQPIPGLRDLAKETGIKITIIEKDAAKVDITFLDILSYFAVKKGFQDPRPFVEVIEGLNQWQDIGSDNIRIDLGHFQVSDPRRGQTQAAVVNPVIPGASTTPGSPPTTTVMAKADSATANPALNKPGVMTQIKNVLKDVSFPILENPLTIFKIITGEPILDGTLFTFTPPVLTNAGFSLNADFPLPFAGDLITVGLGGSFSLATNLKFGYDLQGVRDFVNHGKSNPMDLVNGFFISSRDGKNFNTPGLTFNGSLSGSAAVGPNLANLAKLVVGFEGGVRAAITMTPNDPNRDGKVRINEIVDNIQIGKELYPDDPIKAATYAFDMNGKIEGFFSLFASAGTLGVDLVKLSLELGSGTIYQFSTRRAVTPGITIHPPTANFGALDAHDKITSGITVDESTGAARVGFANPKSDNPNARYKFDYDLDNNGSFEVVNEAMTFNVPSSVFIDGPGNVTVRGRITDVDSGLSTEYTTNIGVNNLPPVSQFLNDGPYVVGVPVTVGFVNGDKLASPIPNLPKTGGVVNVGNQFFDAAFTGNAGPNHSIYINPVYTVANGNNGLQAGSNGEFLYPPAGATWSMVLPALRAEGGRYPIADQTSFADVHTSLFVPADNNARSYQIHAKSYFFVPTPTFDQLATIHQPELVVNGVPTGSKLVLTGSGRATYNNTPYFAIWFEGDLDIPASLLQRGFSNDIVMHFDFPGYTANDRQFEFAATITGKITSPAATDPSPVDITAGFKYSYDFNNDGDFDDIYGGGLHDISNSSSSTATFPSSLFDAATTRVAHGRITDKDNGSLDLYTTIHSLDGVDNSGGPYSLREGEGVTFKIGTTLPPGISRIDWRYLGNTIASGSNPSVSWEALRAAGIGGSRSPDYTLQPVAIFGNGAQGLLSSTTLHVTDTPPNLSATGANVATEGQPYQLQINQPSDPGNDSISQWIIDWKDGTTDTVSIAPNGKGTRTHARLNPDGSPMVDDHRQLVLIEEDLGQIQYPLRISHTFVGPATGYSIHVQAVDGDGAYDAATIPITMLRLAPVMNAVNVSATTINEGSELTLTGYFFAIPSHYLHDVSVDWGDGSAKSEITLSEGERSFGDTPRSELKHRYLDNSPLFRLNNVTVTITDEFGNQSSMSRFVNVINVPPSATLKVSGATVEGSPITVSSLIDDPSPIDLNNVILHDWRVEQISTHFMIQQGFGPTVTFTPSDNGDYAVHLRVMDKEQGSTETQIIMHVLNVPPVPTIYQSSAVYFEGETIKLNGVASDAGQIDRSSAFLYNWSVSKNGNPYSTGGGPNFEFTPDDNGHYETTLTVADKDGGAQSTTASIDVANVAPTASIVGLPPTIMEGDQVDLTANLRDGGLLDVMSGLGLSWRVVRNGMPGSLASATGLAFSFSGLDAGDYTVELIVSDKDGGSSTVRQSFTVTNAAPAAFITVPENDIYLEGTKYLLHGSSSDRSAADLIAGVLYRWEITKNNNPFGQGVGTDMEFLPDDNGDYLVTFYATDVHGDVGKATLPISVDNVAPTVLTISGKPISPHGIVPISLHVDATDVSPIDGSAGMLYEWTVLKEGALLAKGKGPDVNFTTANKGDYQVSVLVRDKDGGYTIANDVISVVNTPPSLVVPKLVAGTINEGANASLSGSFSDIDLADGHTVVINWGDGTAPETFTLAAGVQSFNGKLHRYLDNPQAGTSSYRITMQVTDTIGDSDVGSTNIVVNNVAPRPTIVGACSTTLEGKTTRLSATVSDPSPIDTASGFAYSWVIAKDNVPYASGNQRTIDFTPNDNGTYAVSLTVTDKDGGRSVATKTIVAKNDVPLAQLIAPATAARGQSRTFAIKADDPSSVDDAAGFSYKVSWGDGKADSVRGFAATNLDHTYLANGTYDVKLSAVDKDGGVSSVVTKRIVVRSVDQQGSLLVIGGSMGDDEIEIGQQPQGVRVQLHNSIDGQGNNTDGDDSNLYQNVGRIVVYGQAGHDKIQVADNVAIFAELFGGDGNDVLKAGRGSSLLVGGDGDDVLNGGNGRNILIGGKGRDRLVTGSGENVLVAGYTDFDANEAALQSLLTEWSRSDADRSTRIKHLKGELDGGFNGSNLLSPATIHNDGVLDNLKGRASRDLIFSDLGDLLTD